jgi:hypothetical protein
MRVVLSKEGPYMKLRNRGQILVLFTLALVVLIGLAALGVDVGYMYSVRHELQRCADAGALAGASRFINAPGETGQWGDPDVFSEATARAIDYASKDNVVRTPLLTQPDDNIIVTFPNQDRIMVQTERTVPLFFSKLFLGATKRITAYAVAEASSIGPSANQTSCVAPFGVPLPWKEVGGDPFKFEPAFGDSVYWPTKPDGSLDKDALDAKCAESGNAPITRWSYVTHDNVGIRSPRDSYFCPGTLMHLKIGDPKKTQEPGHFYGLDFSAVVTGCPPGVVNSGASFYKYMIKNKDCNTGCKVSIDPGAPFPPLSIEPGNMVGPTVQAIAPTYYKSPLGFISGGWPDLDSLMNGYGPPAPSDYDQIDNYLDPEADWDFTSNSPQTNVTDRRIIEVPIYDPRTPPSPGKSEIQPIAFGGFWIQDIDDNQGTITARLITIKASESGGSDPGPGGAASKILRLVE